MVLIGYLAFLDPPKLSTRDAIAALHEHGVEVKILTGDNEKVSKTICKMVGLVVSRVVTGDQVEDMDDESLARTAETTTVFARLAPTQKSRIVSLLRQKGHSVGYMGDGINDVTALKDADVGISVDTGVDIAKESADVILLEKDLMVLEEGIVEGRRTYANMIKYIKMTASSNFGNVLSMLIAAAFLPFLPMTAIQILILVLIYDFSVPPCPGSCRPRLSQRTPQLDATHQPFYDLDRPDILCSISSPTRPLPLDCARRGGGPLRSDRSAANHLVYAFFQAG